MDDFAHSMKNKRLISRCSLSASKGPNDNNLWRKVEEKRHWGHGDVLLTWMDTFCREVSEWRVGCSRGVGERVKRVVVWIGPSYIIIPLSCHLSAAFHVPQTFKVRVITLKMEFLILFLRMTRSKYHISFRQDVHGIKVIRSRDNVISTMLALLVSSVKTWYLSSILSSRQERLQFLSKSLTNKSFYAIPPPAANVVERSMML